MERAEKFTSRPDEASKYTIIIRNDSEAKHRREIKLKDHVIDVGNVA